jgi:hypothetical protein
MTQRAYWNSGIAQHHVEGFFLNMGGMLVKAGDWQVARKIYANAKTRAIMKPGSTVMFWKIASSPPKRMWPSSTPRRPARKQSFWSTLQSPVWPAISNSACSTPPNN